MTAVTQRPCLISEAMGVLLEPKSVAELRAPSAQGRTFSGYFDDHSRLAKAAAGLSERAPGVYVTLNPVRPELLARAVNKVVQFAKNATRDSDILSRRWLGLDFDPVRPPGISSTEAEHEAALERAQCCTDWLSAKGWPAPVSADSGNGAHLLYRLDIPNDAESTDLVKHCLQALALLFDDDQVIVDLSTYNASRIWKVYGTLAAKGDNTPDRPHRLARLLDVPSRVEVVSPELLAQLAGRVPPAPKGHSRKANFALVAWISRHQIPVVSEGPWNGGRKWILNPCPWNPEHTNRSAFLVQLAGGAIAAGCHHASCADKNWAALRELFDADQKAEAGEAELSEDGHGGEIRKQENLTQVMRLLLLGAEAGLFHTPAGDLFASIPVNGHVENWPLKSKQFRQWLLCRYYLETKGAPKSQALQEAIGIFESRANFEGPEYPVFTRLAERDGRTYLDLGNDAWEVVEIDPNGWRVRSDVPVKFRRARGMSPLPDPVRGGGSVNELRRFVNVASEQDWILLAAWLVAAFRPHGPYPILVLHGEQGSAKSTTSRVLRGLLDPNTAPMRGEPRNLRDVMIAASNGWIISFDNLSRIPNWLSDALCRLATGGGFSTRELYTDSEEVLFDEQRPAIFNGIEELASRGDLLDRALILYLPSIPEQKREPESKFWSNFEAARPHLLSALLDVVSGALRRLPNIELPRKPRLVDFAVWATAAEPLLGIPKGAFMSAYAQNQSSANELALEASPVAGSLQVLASNGTFEGTATQLLQVLSAHADESVRSQRSWPANGQVLSNAIRRLAPNLRKCGIDISFSRDPNRHRRRSITVCNLASTPSGASDGPDSTAYRPQVNSVAANLEVSGHSAFLENCLDTEDLNVMSDDVDEVDARTQPSEPVPVLANDASQSPRLRRQSEENRLKGEL